MSTDRPRPPAGRPQQGAPLAPTAPARPPSPRVPARPARPVSPGGPSVLSLVLWPALLTLAVTLLRLTGEVLGWSPSVFSRLPGGGLSPLGITWLAPVVGFWLGWRLERAGVGAPPPSRAFGLPAAALALGLALATLAENAFQPSWTANLALWAAVAVAVAVAAFATWPALGRPLLAYAGAARVPVAIVMALAIWRQWGTHYDVVPPGFPPMRPFRRFFWIGLLPQATLWVAWTMATGAFFGALGHWSAAARRRRL